MKEKCLKLLQCFVFIVILSGCMKRETQDAKEGGAIRSLPLQFAEKACSDMPDGSYAVVFDGIDLKKTDNGFELTLEFFDYDRYSKEDILAIKQGDTINITLYENAGKESKTSHTDLTVETIEIKNDKDGNPQTAILNNGLEQGGVELYFNKDFDVFENCSWDDYPIYYSIGEASIPISKDMTFQDCIDYDTLPDGLITYYDDLPGSIIEAEEKCQFTYLSMEAVIRNREIVQLIRNWVP